MKVRDLYIERCEWHVRIYIASTCYYTDQICKSLSNISCPEEILQRAQKSMEQCKLNTGLTYSNGPMHESVMVIALASAPNQFLNSFTHEMRHLTDHILKEMGYKVGGEPVAYLSGDIAGTLWEDIHYFTCCNCYGRRH